MREAIFDPVLDGLSSLVSWRPVPLCAAHGGCKDSTASLSVCTGNSFPASGGCLGAQGVDRCP